MNSIRVEPEKGTVRAEGGVTIGELDHETQAFGLAVPMGVVTATGIAGLTLGGGLGWLRLTGRRSGCLVESSRVKPRTTSPTSVARS